MELSEHEAGLLGHITASSGELDTEMLQQRSALPPQQLQSALERLEQEQLVVKTVQGWHRVEGSVFETDYRATTESMSVLVDWLEAQVGLTSPAVHKRPSVLLQPAAARLLGHLSAQPQADPHTALEHSRATRDDLDTLVQHKLVEHHEGHYQLPSQVRPSIQEHLLQVDERVEVLEQHLSPQRTLDALVERYGLEHLSELDGLVREAAPHATSTEAYEEHVASLSQTAATEPSSPTPQQAPVGLPVAQVAPTPPEAAQAPQQARVTPAQGLVSLWVPEESQSQPQRRANPSPSWEVRTPLNYGVPLQPDTPETPPEAPHVEAPDEALSPSVHLQLVTRQLAALDADTHHIVVRVGADTKYLAPDADGAGFVVSEEPVALSDRDVVAALPTLRNLNLNHNANLDLVSFSERHQYGVLEGLDATQADQLSEAPQAALRLSMGEQHTIVVKLPADDEHAEQTLKDLKQKVGTPRFEEQLKQTATVELEGTAEPKPEPEAKRSPWEGRTFKANPGYSSSSSSRDDIGGM